MSEDKYIVGGCECEDLETALMVQTAFGFPYSSCSPNFLEAINVMNEERYKVGDKVFLNYLEAAEYKRTRAIMDYKCSPNFLKIYLKSRREPVDFHETEYMDDDPMNEQFYGQG
jgi:hypothetical protein